MDNIVVMVIIAIIGSYDGSSISVDTSDVSQTTCDAMKEQAKNPPVSDGVRYGSIQVNVYCLPK